MSNFLVRWYLEDSRKIFPWRVSCAVNRRVLAPSHATTRGPSPRYGCHCQVGSLRKRLKNGEMTRPRSRSPGMFRDSGVVTTVAQGGRPVSYSTPIGTRVVFTARGRDQYSMRFDEAITSESLPKLLVAVRAHRRTVALWSTHGGGVEASARAAGVRR